MSTVRHMSGPKGKPRQRTSPLAPSNRERPNGAGTGETVQLRNKGEDIFTVIRQLNDLLVKENVALKKHRIEDVRILGERKTDLARLYQQQMNAIHRNPDLLKEMDETKRTALVQAGTRLGDLMKENASLLKANISVINRLMKAVVDTVREKRERKSTSYSEDGNLDGYAVDKRYMAVSFNEVT